MTEISAPAVNVRVTQYAVRGEVCDFGAHLGWHEVAVEIFGPSRHGVLRRCATV
jgi:hypothetical protein